MRAFFRENDIARLYGRYMCASMQKICSGDFGGFDGPFSHATPTFPSIVCVVSNYAARRVCGQGQSYVWHCVRCFTTVVGTETVFAFWAEMTTNLWMLYFMVKILTCFHAETLRHGIEVWSISNMEEFFRVDNRFPSPIA